MSLGYPGPDLFKCLLSILSGITMSDAQFFQNELEGYDVEWVVIHNQYWGL